ncbi:hypothetical protein MVES_001077 [Malassezia vespertilionis]|uniref:Sfi1 spindle body domain-containing protein n=1 Tax=Malassezia vespertilionis TaxID=2020962 RepID=A0A2N1JEE6_9BASI|nr:hypothetical protein MVES_001077 [Malassezia vespertilionis]
MEPVLGAPGHTSLFFNSSFASDSSDGSAAASSAGPSRLQHLATSFHLHDAEIAFFDQVLRGLDDTSSSFSELKHMYNACIQDTSLVTQVARTLELTASYRVADIRAAVDTRLWNTLLSLVQVRGSTWRERWDSVRVSIGLEPLDTPDTEEPYAMNTLADALAFADPETSTADLDSHAWDRRIAQRCYNVQILRAAWAQWREQTAYRHMEQRQERHADAFDAALVRERAWRAWRRTFARCCALERTASKAHSARAHEHVALTFTEWRLHAKAQFIDRVCRAQALRTAWNQWWQAFTTRTVQMQCAERDAASLDRTRPWRLAFARNIYARASTALLRTHSDTRLLCRCVNRWRKTARQRHMAARRAEHSADVLLLTRAVAQWRTRYEVNVHMDQKAAATHTLHLLARHRAHLRRWHTHAKRRRMHRTMLSLFHSQHKQAVLQQTWDQWRDVFAETLLAHEEYATFAYRRRRMLHTCWGRWLARTSLLPAVELRRRSLQSSAWQRWVGMVLARRQRRNAAIFTSATL